MIIDNQGRDKMSHDKYSSIVYKGKTLKEWAEINGVRMPTVRERLRKGYPIEVAIKPKKLNYNPTYQ